MTGRAVDGRAARQPVRAGRQRADVDVRLAVARRSWRAGCAAARRRRGAAAPTHGQRHLDVGRGRVVGVHRAHAHGDRLVAAVLEPVQLQAQQRQRGIADQPADGVLPEALERAPVVALAGREEAPVPAAVGQQRQRPPLARVAGHQHRRRLAVARPSASGAPAAWSRPARARGTRLMPSSGGQLRPALLVLARVEQQRRHGVRAPLRRQLAAGRCRSSDRRRSRPSAAAASAAARRAARRAAPSRRSRRS